MPIPVITIRQMREWEQATWATGQTEAEVIRRVGVCVGQGALQLTRPGERILILAGKGNNGQDALAARPTLANREVELLEVTDPAADLPKLATLLSRQPALLIDGLFGIGLNRPFEPAWIAFIQAVNESGKLILAVDVPSGLNADTGETFGAAIKAAVTLTVGAAKPGLLTEAAVPFVGRLEVAQETGLIRCPHPSTTQWTVAEDFAGFPPVRGVATHKGTYGHAGLIAGSLGFHGAAVLAARAAQRAQPGLITLQTLEAVYHAVAPQLQAVMVSPWQLSPKLAGTFDAVLVGPGLAAPDLPDPMKMLVRHVWRDATCPLVVDASALDWLPLDPVPKQWVRVLTPHPGEAARLLRASIAQVQANRVNAVRNISRRYANAWVVLKGHQTVIGRSTGEVFVNSSGNPHLAQGGSGDVLAGYLTGLLAQSALRVDVAKSICYAVWQHGAAADALTAAQPNWVVEDLIPELGRQPSAGR